MPTPLGSLSHAAASPEVLQWASAVGDNIAQAAYLNGGLLAHGGPQVFSGDATVFTGNKGEKGILGFGIPTVKISRQAPPGTGISSALLIIDDAPANLNGSEWALLIKLTTEQNFNNPGASAVGLYSQVYKYGQTESWGITVEAQDFTIGGTSAMVGIEIGLSYGGVDAGSGPSLNGLKDCLTLVFSDVAPNGSNPAGPVICIGDVINIAAGADVNRFHALRAINVHSGCYEQAIIDMRFVHDSPFALRIAGGCHLDFYSGTSGYSRPYWYPNLAYAPTWVGAIEIVIDGAFYYIPVANNMP